MYIVAENGRQWFPRFRTHRFLERAGLCDTCDLPFRQTRGDYPSNAVSSQVDSQTGEFSAVISRDYNGPIDVLITALHLNGDTTTLHTATSSKGRVTDTERLNLEWAFTTVESLARSGNNAGALAATKVIATAHADATAFAARAAAWERLLSALTRPGATPAARAATENDLALFPAD